MRTTLTLDDDVVEIVKGYAAVRNLSLGGAVSDLVRKGASAPLRTKMVNGLAVLVLPPDSPLITTEHIKALEAEI